MSTRTTSRCMPHSMAYEGEFEVGYTRCMTSAWRVYDECMTSAWRVYDECTTSVRRVHDECMTSA